MVSAPPVLSESKQNQWSAPAPCLQLPPGPLLPRFSVLHFKDKVSWNRKMAEKGRRLEFRRETSVCVLCVRERICGVAAAVLVAALQLILGRGATSRAVLRWCCEPRSHLQPTAGRATGRQSCSSRLVAPVGGGGDCSGSGALNVCGLW